MQYLDHRRLEEGFLLLAALQVIMRYNIKFKNGNDDIPLERNKLVEMVLGEYEKFFYEKWTGKWNKINVSSSCKCQIMRMARL